MSDRLISALRAEPPALDDLTRERWLARMAPELDAIAADARARATAPAFPRWPLLAAAAALGVIVAWAVLRDRPRADAPPPPVFADRAVLHPYDVTGADPQIATTLRSGRFERLETLDDQIVRATYDRERERRIALVGSTRVVVESSNPMVLTVAGIVLVDQRAAGTLELHVGAHVIAAQQASFAVSTSPTLAIVVDRGELVVDGVIFRAATRDAHLLELLRQHEASIISDGVIASAAPAPAPPPLAPPPSPPKPVPTIRARVAPPPPVVEQLPPPPPTTAPVVETARDLYAQTEHALRAGDRAGAEVLLLHLVATFPDTREAATARYDLANLVRARDPARARGYLTEMLAGSPPASLREPATYLACRLAVELQDLAGAVTCFTQFRVQFPASSHDAEVLAWLAGHAEESNGCAGARALAVEYLRRYPRGPFAPRAKHCGGT